MEGKDIKLILQGIGLLLQVAAIVAEDVAPDDNPTAAECRKLADELRALPDLKTTES